MIGPSPGQRLYESQAGGASALFGFEPVPWEKLDAEQRVGWERNAIDFYAKQKADREETRCR